MQRMKAVLSVVVALTLLIGTYPLEPALASTTRVASPTPAASAAVAPAWPKIIDRDGNHIIVYQPQLKSWEKYRTLVADTAISFTPAGGKQFLGVISWRANTVANVSARTVYVSDIQVISSRFPTLDPQHEAEAQQKVSQIYPTMTFNVSLNHMIASLEKVKEPVNSAAVSTQVPAIFASTTPAIVLMVDGKPVLVPIEGTKLQYVVNTNWDLFYDGAEYFLLSGKTR